MNRYTGPVDTSTGRQEALRADEVGAMAAPAGRRRSWRVSQPGRHLWPLFWCPGCLRAAVQQDGFDLTRMEEKLAAGNPPRLRRAGGGSSAELIEQ